MNEQSQIRFILNSSLRKAADITYNASLSLTRKAIYKRILEDANISYDKDLNLSLDGKPHNNSVAGPGMKRNNTVLETYDGSLTIELVNVRTKVTQSNTIVSTPLSGREGTFKEFIQANDFKVELFGSLVADSRTAFPLKEYITLRRVLQTAKQLKVASVLLQAEGITEMVFKSGTKSPSRFMNVSDFRLSFISDEEYSLYIEE